MTAAIARKVRRWARDMAYESSLRHARPRRRPRDRTAGARLGVGPAGAGVGQRGVSGPGAARAGVPRRGAARRRLGGRRPRAALGAHGRPRSFIEQPRRRTWRSGAAPRGGCSPRAATRRCSSRCTARRSTSASMPTRRRRRPRRRSGRTWRSSARCRPSSPSGLDPAEVDRNRRLILVARPVLAGALPWQRGDARGRAGRATASATIRLEPARRRPPPTRQTGATTAPSRPRGDRAFVVDPWPFAAGVVVVGCEARRLAGPFGDDAELRAALAAAPWVPLRWELSPG